MTEPAGTPLWLTLVLQAVTALGTLYGTHRLASVRERKKKQDDVVKDWQQSQEKLLDDCVTLARTHYLNPSSLDGTAVSAQEIILKLRKFRNRFSDVASVDSSYSAEAARLFTQLNDLITGPEDFQDSERAVRLGSDSLFEHIADCEEALRRNFRNARTVK